jgi:PPOX class probable F420-dependent enzyme
MIPQEMQDLLQHKNAILAVNRPSGGPQVTPIWFIWDGEAFYFSTTKDRAKYTHIQRDPSISLIVDGGPRYIAAYGKAEIIDPHEPGLSGLIEQMVAKYVPPEQKEQAEQLRRRVQEPNRVIVKLRPEKVVARDERIVQSR